MKSKVAVFGSFVVDLMARSSGLPSAGQTIKGSTFRMGAGGKGFNQAVACHKSGGVIDVVTRLGRDTMSCIAENAMDEINLSKDHLIYSDKEMTGVALISVDECSGQNSIVVIPGACGGFTADDVKQAENLISDSEYLLLQLEVNQDANEKIASFAKQHGVRVIVNTAPYQPVTDEFLHGCYLVTPNEVEAQQLTGIAIDNIEDADRAASFLFDKGVQNVIITLGGRGVYVNDGIRSEIIPAYRVDAIDTTGAGDAFNGGLLTALSEGQNLFEASHFASAVAALSVQRIGTTPSMPSRDEIELFLQNVERD